MKDGRGYESLDRVVERWIEGLSTDHGDGEWMSVLVQSEDRLVIYVSAIAVQASLSLAKQLQARVRSVGSAIAWLLSLPAAEKNFSTSARRYYLGT